MEFRLGQTQHDFALTCSGVFVVGPTELLAPADNARPEVLRRDSVCSMARVQLACREGTRLA